MQAFIRQRCDALKRYLDARSEMQINGMTISVVPTGEVETGDAFGAQELVQVQIFITGPQVAMPLPGTFWRPKSEMTQ